MLAVVTALGVAGCSGVQARERGDSLLLGTAMRTINPPLGVPLVGYPSGRPNTGVALDLCARAAVFGTPGNTDPAAALVVLDLLRSPCCGQTNQSLSLKHRLTHSGCA